MGHDLELVRGLQDSDAKYSLYAVLVHAGWSTHSGHYYCFVRTAGDMWHALDDSRVCVPSPPLLSWFCLPIIRYCFGGYPGFFEFIVALEVSALLADTFPCSFSCQVILVLIDSF